MQLKETAGTITASDGEFDLPEAGRRILALEHELEEARAIEEELTAAFEEAEADAEREFRHAREELEEAYRGRVAGALTGEQERRSRIDRDRNARRERVRRAAAALEKRLQSRIDRIEAGAEAEHEKIRERLAADDDRRRSPLEKRVRRLEGLLPEVREQYAGIREILGKFAALNGMTLGEVEPWSGEVRSDLDPDGMAEEIRATFDEVLADMRQAGRGFGAGLVRRGTLLLYSLALLLLAASGTALAIQLGAEPLVVAAGPAFLVVGGVLLALAARNRRRRFRTRAHELAVRLTHAAERFEKNALAALKQMDARHIQCAEETASLLARAEEKLRVETETRLAPPREEIEEVRRRLGEAEARLEQKHRARLEELAAEYASVPERIDAEMEAEIDARTSERRQERERARAVHAERIRELADRRERALSAFSEFATGARREVEDHPAWADVAPKNVVLPARFPTSVPFGRLRLTPPAPPGSDGAPASEFILPAVLSFPDQGSLLVRHEGEERGRALALLSGVVLRLLASFPAGKVRLTILDPVGLGESFSALMHLADHDEALVNGRIWTETPHIERRLADLTEHIEKVIQKYLRNRFDSIGEYNAEAGELQEPYHFLVVADFPLGFSEVAAERLASIANSGPRCGVYTLVAQDTRQSVSVPVDVKRMMANGPVLAPEDGGFRIATEGLDRCEFLPEPLPPPIDTARILDSIGRQSVDADHVELPFAAVAPSPDEIWTGNTDAMVRVAIGRTGAERLQQMSLGRGTAQHALIAGRTGSGKSTLFHVLITNLALWLSPDEIEFYLIDFKKGVEFKPFATHALPHARVVAIESDREFGLSVLRAIDAELARRGDLFRRHGVQDMPSYRRNSSEGPLPRTLVVIDEFQEFFTEDDAVARDAALLLDRFVRQGRAFGIHIVLGSQTLSGIYSLAKSTLGQMGVRIALQCNEADSYLILSEENGVARLLSRPGEAIYNDMSGLIEGNNPFQVVWLDDEEEDGHLETLRRRFEATPSLARRGRVVFEGNVPADLAANPELNALLADGPPAARGDDRIWLGDPNAIKGPTEVRFSPVSGSNLLVVGQRRDCAFAMMAAAILSLSAQYRPGEVRFVILDGGGHEPEYATHFANLIEAVPHRVERCDLRSVADAVAEIAEEVTARESSESRAPIYVFAFGLQRLRMLRREDEFAMSFGGEETASAGEHFANLLTEGPAQNVHTTIWCDTYANLARTLSRKAIREFDVRVLFQMSAADSSELIDSSAANLLGLYNALLAIESQGTFEKFRPYAIPGRDLMRRMAGRESD